MRRVTSFVLLLGLGLVGCGEALEQLEQLEKASTVSTSVGAGQGEPTAAAPTTEPPAQTVPATTTSVGAGGKISICSFNIQFLGNSTRRDDNSLAELMAPYDIVVIQELVSPPYPGLYPDGTPVKPDSESAEFFDSMALLGFHFILSEEDTGTGDANHRNGSSTEWWVTFYRPEKVRPASDLPHGFLAADRSNHPDWERVPYAFPFRTLDGTMDFVLISVHLMPGGGRKETARRKHELAAIAAWIERNDLQEHDFIILGDMNIEDVEELADATPRGFKSLNDECRPTNTSPKSPKPYDHVMYNVTSTTEIDEEFDMKVVDLVEAMQSKWELTGEYPGAPYDHNAFRAYFSDHDPVVFQLTMPSEDDDGVVRTATLPVE